ncbi:MAG: ABC transporter ATP-binding protein [Planctomycetota bacterium]
MLTTSDTSGSALEVRNITKRFGSFTAVRDVNFTVARGEVCGFIGPNGAGKTTTMRICATLELPDTGDVFIGGHSVLEEPRLARQQLGFMPDSFGAYAATTVTEYLDFFARAYGLKGAQRARTIAEVMEFTSLGPLADKLTSSLSKGMKQRMCLAKTLLHDPALLILDEPASGLDPRARVELRELVRALAEMGKAVLISSHILTELAEVCDSVAVIEAGRLMANGRVDEVMKGIRPTAELWMRCLAPTDALERFLAERHDVVGVRREGRGVALEFQGDEGALAELVAALVRAELKPVEFAPRETNLEDVFLQLTKGKLQ